MEKPGPVTVNVEKHSYDGRWFNPATGISVKIKEIKDEVFTGEPPDRTHDWVLQISREGRKASMLKSYKFDSREGGIVMQEIEGNPEKVPFDGGRALRRGDFAEQSGGVFDQAEARDEGPAAHDVRMDGRGHRLGPALSRHRHGRERHFPHSGQYRARLSRPRCMSEIVGMNGLGKVYTLDRNFTLNHDAINTLLS